MSIELMRYPIRHNPKRSQQCNREGRKVQSGSGVH